MSINLKKYVAHQLDTNFPVYGVKTEFKNIHLDTAIARAEYCFSRVATYSSAKVDPFHSGKYSTFLYLLANTIYASDGQNETATRLFLLNKMLNGIDLFYDIEMPSVFLIGHTVGMVFAKAEYGDFCVFHQGCTVGRNFEDRPSLGEGVIMYPNSSVIGRCVIGNNTVISPGVQIVNRSIPGDCMVFMGKDGDLIFKDLNELFVKRYLILN